MQRCWKNYPNVWFGPNAQTASQWQAGQHGDSRHPRGGFTNKIAIERTAYTGAWTWVSSRNAAAWAGYSVGASNNLFFEMHQDLDSDGCTHSTCATGSGTRLSAATSWLATNGFQGLLGEFAWTEDSSCATPSVQLMNSKAAAPSWWPCWAWWNAGPFYQSYMFTLNPSPSFAVPTTLAPQLALLQSYR
jgi:endoglucanase